MDEKLALELAQKAAILEMEKIEKAAIRIQAIWRGYHTRQEFIRMVTSAIKIQTAWRSVMALRILEQLRHEAEVNAAQCRLDVAATKIQSLWRGFRVRKAIVDEKVEAARLKVIEQAKKASPDQCLGNRTKSALIKLLAYTNLSPLGHQLQSLEITTRLSPESCLTLSEPETIAVLVRVISECNRSVPHIALVNSALEVLINLAVFDQTRRNLVKAISVGIDVILTKLKNHRNDEKIVCAITTLLYLLIKEKRDLLNDAQETELFKVLEQMKKPAATVNGSTKGLAKSGTFSSRPAFLPFWSLKADSSGNKFDNRVTAAECLESLLRPVVRPKVTK
jgi:myosin heavy subunit